MEIISEKMREDKRGIMSKKEKLEKKWWKSMFTKSRDKKLTTEKVVNTFSIAYTTLAGDYTGGVLDHENFDSDDENFEIAQKK